MATDDPNQPAPTPKPTAKPKLCMFCGLDVTAGPMDAEHFVPKCLWAGPRPSGTVTVPAHVECNRAAADDNDYFRMVMAFDDHCQTHPEARRVVDGPLNRMMTNHPGRFMRHAQDYRLKPRFSEMGLYLGVQPCFPIDGTRIVRVVRNVFRGMFMALTGNPLQPNRSILVDLVGDVLDGPTRYFVDRMGPWTSFGDDVFRCRYGFKEGMDDMVCLMRFYNRKTFYAISNVSKRLRNNPAGTQVVIDPHDLDDTGDDVDDDQGDLTP